MMPMTSGMYATCKMKQLITKIYSRKNYLN